MRSRSVSRMSGASLMGMAVGLVAGVAAGLLTAPMRGADMRANLRSRADNALDRGMMLLEEGRRAFRTGQSAAADTTPGALTATLGEIAQMHSGDGLSTTEARS